MYLLTQSASVTAIFTPTLSCQLPSFPTLNLPTYNLANTSQFTPKASRRQANFFKRCLNNKKPRTTLAKPRAIATFTPLYLCTAVPLSVPRNPRNPPDTTTTF